MSLLQNISSEDFKWLADLIYGRFGIVLNESKKPMVANRLQKYFRQKGFASFADLKVFINQDKTGQALVDLSTVLSTNHTFFNRESEHFDFFRQKTLPYWGSALAVQPTKDFRVWCAGCSSGEEPYMLAILMLEHLKEQPGAYTPRLLATDISIKALTTAKAGIYTAERLEKMPTLLKTKYFTKKADGNYEVNAEVRSLITFRRFNLMNEVFPFKQPFHSIFCRNVMIYFDEETKKALVGRFHQFLLSGGNFFIGHSESLGRNSIFEYIQPALYKKS